MDTEKAAARSPRRVMLVEDEEDFSSLTSEQLRRRGFHVTVMESGEQALAHCAAHPPDAVILDVLLPGINGLEVLKRLKSNPATEGIPVLVCSISAADRPQVRLLLGLGASDFLRKPCPPDELARRLTELLDAPPSN